jgi:Zn-dependent protease
MRLRIGNGFGIPVYLHWTFFLLIPWILLTQPEEAAAEWPIILTTVPLFFFCVVLHEFGHALTARQFGIDTQDVTLYPIGGVARLMRMTDKPLEEFLIAVAGPAVNVVIALVLFCVLLPIFVLNSSLVLGTFAGRVALGLLVLNIIMVPFNLLPAFPMDGGRVLRSVLSACLGHYQGTRIAVWIGMAMAAVIGLIGTLVLGNPMLLVIAVFVFFAGQQELRAAAYREQRRRGQFYDEDEEDEGHEEEPLQALPVRPVPLEPPPMPVLMYQPTISVYTWDNQTGTWRKEASPLGRRSEVP